jgi:hypothetical protein
LTPAGRLPPAAHELGERLELLGRLPRGRDFVTSASPPASLKVVRSVQCDMDSDAKTIYLDLSYGNPLFL